MCVTRNYCSILEFYVFLNWKNNKVMFTHQDFAVVLDTKEVNHSSQQTVLATDLSDPRTCR